MIVVLIQKEVAERIVAAPGDYSKLSLSIQLYGKPRIAFLVPRTAFHPIPEVDSAVLVIEDIHQWEYSVAEREVWRLITFGFSARRKKLVNNLMAGLQLSRESASDLLKKADIPANIRAEDMSIESWLSLAKVVIPRVSDKES
jgi:16S rRNA (adenine1518-N6/adenine1519-N6)-dimethyltransferase